MVRYALISTWDKRGVAELGKGLEELGFTVISTGGTARVLRDAGVKVVEVSQLTGFPEVFEGRVKTLHPLIFGGILFRRGKDEAEGFPRIDLVAVNFYPFWDAAEAGFPEDELLEMIDIGGPSLVRAAAKNYKSVVVLTDPQDYGWVLERLRAGDLTLKERRHLAAKAFSQTALYDIAIFNELWGRYGEGLPPAALLGFRLGRELRYGENPHQKAAFYGSEPWEVLWGKPLSYNNILDAAAAWEALRDIEEFGPSAVIVKHLSPCGAAVGKSLEEAYEGALASDPVSAFGGIVALSEPPSPQLARRLNEHFFEIVLAPDYPDESLGILQEKKNRRLLRVKSWPRARWEARSVPGGLLLQEPDTDNWGEFRVAVGEVGPEERFDLTVAWRVVKHVRSNAIVLVKGGATVGIGGGLPSRVDAARLAIEKAGERARGAVMASDAFFPFPDAVELAAKAGVKAVIQPGGSVRDKEVLEAARRLGVAMVLTGRRHFRH